MNRPETVETGSSISRFSITDEALLRGCAGRLLGVSVLAAGLFYHDVANAAGDLECYNYAPGSVNENRVRFVENGADGGYLSYPFPPSMEIWYEDGSGNQHSIAGVDDSISKTYKCPLQFNGTVPDGTTNYIRFHFNNAFPSQMLFTYVVDANGKLRVGDARKKILEGPTAGYSRVYLDNVTNAVGQQIYGTNWVNIAPVETAITGFQINQVGQAAALTARERPGTVSWPEGSDNLQFTNTTSLTNLTQYLLVTTNNFAGFDIVSWTNLPLPSSPYFYRVVCDSYNSATSNLVFQSQGN